MPDRPIISLNENDPAKAARSGRVIEGLNAYIKSRKPALYAELEAGTLLWLIIYDEPPERILELIPAMIEKYQVDVTIEVAVLTNIDGIGPVFGGVARPRPGRGTPEEIQRRQCGITTH